MFPNCAEVSLIAGRTVPHFLDDNWDDFCEHIVGFIVCFFLRISEVFGK